MCYDLVPGRASAALASSDGVSSQHTPFFALRSALSLYISDALSVIAATLCRIHGLNQSRRKLEKLWMCDDPILPHSNLYSNVNFSTTFPCIVSSLSAIPTTPCTIESPHIRITTVQACICVNPLSPPPSPCPTVENFATNPDALSVWFSIRS